jgi:hypothetical protein
MPSNRTVLIVSLVATPLLCVIGAVAGFYAMAAMYPATPDEPDASIPALTSSQFASEWNRNPAAAADKYSRDPVRITGTVRKIGMSLGVPWAQISDDPSSPTVFVMASSRAAEADLKKCQIGNRVSVLARSGAGSELPTVVAESITPVN